MVRFAFDGRRRAVLAFVWVVCWTVNQLSPYPGNCQIKLPFTIGKMPLDELRMQQIRMCLLETVVVLSHGRLGREKRDLNQPEITFISCQPDQSTRCGIFF